MLDKIYRLFPDEEICFMYVHKLRWPAAPFCPYCKSYNTNSYPCKGTRLQCYGCSRSFFLTVGSILHNTRIPLRKWCAAIMLVLDSEEQISGRQLAKDIGVNKDTACKMMLTIRMHYKRQDKLIVGMYGKLQEWLLWLEQREAEQRNSQLPGQLQ